MPSASNRPELRAWRPAVPGVSEVLHAHFTDHVYPLNTHDTWTLLVVDAGAVRFDPEHHQHGSLRSVVTLLPPHVPHDGRAATTAGFRKRVIYLDGELLDASRTGAAVDHPGWRDPVLRDQVDLLHVSLLHPGDELEAGSRLALVRERLRQHLGAIAPGVVRRDVPLARHLKDLLDSRTAEGVSLEEASSLLVASPTHLVRSFTREVGIPPHRYLTGRRLDAARRLLLQGVAPAAVATRVGFYDQAHLTRHFKRLLGVTPRAFAVSA